MNKYTVDVGKKTIRITSDNLDLYIEEHYIIRTKRYKELLDNILEDRAFDRKLSSHKNIAFSNMSYANGKLRIHSDINEWVSDTTAKYSLNYTIPKDEAIELLKLIISKLDSSEHLYPRQ